MWETIQLQLQNEFLSGGIVLMAFGVALAILRSVPGRLWALLERKIITTVDVPDDDGAFFWIQKWLSNHEYSKRARLLTISTHKSSRSNKEVMVSEGPALEDHVDAPEVLFAPAPGRHLLKFEGRWILLDRQRRDVDHSGDRAHRESFVLHTLCRDREMLRRLVHAAKLAAFPPESKKVVLNASNYSNWNVIGERPPRPPESVVLDEGVKESMFSKVKAFFDASSWYYENGINYQMGMLFYGPPGNGKTSAALSISSYFNLPVYIGSFTGTGDDGVRILLGNLPTRSILLMEDIDCVFSKDKQEEREHITGQKMTLSGLLNSLDGIMGADGRIVIMTTNHIDKLDPALIRKGRIDHQIYFGDATAYQAKGLFQRFFPNEDPELFIKFGKDRPMSDLQSVLIENRNSAHDATEAIRRLIAA